MSSPEQPIDETIEEPTPQDYEAVVRAMAADGHDIDNPEPDAASEGSDEPDTFPRSYVEDLRQENGKYRQRAQQSDQLAQRLHLEMVRTTGRLADPTDLPFDAEHLDDPDKLAGAIDALLEHKPHLASRRPTGDIGQGDRGPASGSFSLLGMLKERT
jgi:hypothetical protein